jgi:hypothetical protein
VDERRRKKHSGAEMPREEEKAMRYGKAGEAAGKDREGACYTGSAYRNTCRMKHTDLACSR